MHKDVRDAEVDVRWIRARNTCMQMFAATLIVKWKIVAHESFISVSSPPSLPLPLSGDDILYRTASNKFAYLHKNAKRPALSYIFDASYKTTQRTIVIKSIMRRGSNWSRSSREQHFADRAIITVEKNGFNEENRYRAIGST